ncbi:MAG: hypothetical protein ACI4U5_02130 [Bacilli bacterium]
MYITKNKKKFFIKCLIYALIVYTIVICSFIMWAVYGKQIEEAYLEEGVLVYYSGKPIFNPFCIFEYLTTINSLIIATAVLFLGIGILINNEKIKKIILNVHIWTYVTTIFTFMFIAVIVFDLITSFEAYRELYPFFGLSFISITMWTSRSVLHHFLYFYYLLLYKGFRPLKDKRKVYFPYIIMVSFYVLWYVIINIVGKFCLQPYEWYPYILIMPKGFFAFAHLPSSPLLYVVYYIGLVSVEVAMCFTYYFVKKFLNKKIAM